ncbi:MAG: SDR family oxidoreductase [Bryobacterales bacterium]|nr:SDR family oxidoreductase [Bryobacterales bacterium]
MTERQWALVLGASSGFGEAASVAFAHAGFDIYGVHMDLRDTLPNARRVEERVREAGREAVFFNVNAADDAKRAEVIGAIRGPVRILLHSLAFGVLRPVTGEAAVNRRQLEATCDAMGHSLLYWARDLVAAGLMPEGGRIFAMTSTGGARAVPSYGPVSAAKAALEAHVRQLAIELAPRRITANAILAGVTDTPALRKIPGFEKLVEAALDRNPHGRLTAPEDVAKCLVALANPDTYWMTGNTIRIDGGEGTVG